jgi:hypothetical protein
MSDEKKNSQAKRRGKGGTIGEISSEIGYDVRDLMMDGYSHAQITRLRKGEITLRELMKEKPEDKR